MDNSPANTDDKDMRELAFARSEEATKARQYVLDIGGKGKAYQIIDAAYEALADMFPESGWTHRRIRAFFGKEQAGVYFGEMAELHVAAKKKKAERELIEKARREHAEFIERTARMATLLERRDEDFHSPEIEGLRGELSRMDRSRDSREG